jgi:hypothetical protein
MFIVHLICAIHKRTGRGKLPSSNEIGGRPIAPAHKLKKANERKIKKIDEILTNVYS